jgi:hypothetical protein
MIFAEPNVITGAAENQLANLSDRWAALRVNIVRYHAAALQRDRYMKFERSELDVCTRIG